MKQDIPQMEPSIGKEEQDAVLTYLRSGGWLTEFKKTREFEKMIANYTGAKYCSVVSNGTVSLAIALWALGIKAGDEVIVPDYTMIASANAVVLAGAKPVLVDIDPENLCLDLESAKKAITKKTKAIILVTINGRSPKMESFVALCRNKKLFLIEDAAQSLGSTYNGRHLGTFGVIGSFSFAMHKIVTTGQGGALVTNNRDIYKKILKIKDFGREESGIDYHQTIGYNFKFTDLQAVIGIEQMKKIKWRAKRKKEMFSMYKKLLKDTAGVQFIETDLRNVSHMFVEINVNNGQRDELMAFLQKKGIGTRLFYPSIHTQPPYKWIKGTFLNSVAVSKKGLWLPSSLLISDKDIGYVCKSIKNFFNS